MALETFASQREKMHGLRRHGAEEGSNVAGKPALRTCSHAKKRAAHRIYVAEHKEQVAAYRRVPNPVKEAKHKADLAEKWFRSQEVLKRIYQRIVDRFGDWEDDYSIVSGEEQLSNPCFIVVDKNGGKRKEVLTEPLPSWD